MPLLTPSRFLYAIPRPQIILPVSQTFYVRPTAHGGGTGLSYSNAADVSALPFLMSSLPPAGVIYVLADDGPYAINAATNSLLLNGGGSPGSPCQIMGVDQNLTPMKASFQSTRDDPATLPSRSKGFEASGYDVFALGDNLHDVILSNLDFQNVGCCFDPRGNLSRVTLQHMTASNFYSFFSNDITNLGALATEDAYLMDTLTFDDIVGIGFSIGGIRIGQRHYQLLLKNFKFDSQDQAFDNFSEGLHFSGTTQVSSDADYLLINPKGGHTAMDGEVCGAFYFSASPNYPDQLFANADGLADESNLQKALYLRIYSHGNTDAGFDLKSNDVSVIDCISEFNKENLKIWPVLGTIRNFKSNSPVKLIGTGGVGHISLFGANNMELTFDNFQATDTLNTQATLILLQSSALGQNNLYLNNADIQLPPGTPVMNAATAPGLTVLHWVPDAPTLALAVNYRTGFDHGRIPNGTAAGTVIADLALTGTGAAGALLELTFDPHSQFVIVGTTLTVASTINVNTFTAHSFTLRATSRPDGLASQSVSGDLYVDAPAWDHACDYEAVNGATTVTDSGLVGGTGTLTSGAVVSTTSPLKGTSSAVFTTGAQKVTFADNDNWALDAMFSILALVNLTTMAVTSNVIAHWSSTSNQRSWTLQVTPAGALVFSFSSNGGASFVTLTSADGLITVAQLYEVAADRDLHGKIRLYVNGVMVASVVSALVFKNSTAGLTIGNTANGSTALAGKVDRTRVKKGWAFCASDAGYAVAA